jgi:hypothetical protein
MKDADLKSLLAAFYFFFILLELVILIEGQAVMLGEDYTGDFVRIFALAGIVASAFGMYLVFKDKKIGYLITVVSIAITVTVYFGEMLIID